MKKINIETSVYTLVGKPIAHSLSPDIYNFGFRYYGLNSVYVGTETEDLNNAVIGIKALGIKGFNITMPYKNEIIRYLDSYSRLASLCGSVNTVITDENGKLYGEMTDGYGFVLALQSRGINIKGMRVEIMGAGGAGRALAVAAVVNEASKVVLANREGENYRKACELLNELSRFKEFKKLSLKKITSIKDYEVDKESEIFVNATSLGMKRNPGSVISERSKLYKNLTVFDLVYENSNTELLQLAREVGCKHIIGGKRQLLFQAAVAFKLYTGLEFPVKEYLEGSMQSIVFLVGFMGAGKTTIGESVSKKLNVSFIDLDKEIEAGTKLTVAELFKREGEQGFRIREHNALQDIIRRYKGEVVVVATGGGTVIQDNNYELMKKYGNIIYLDISFGEVLKRLSVHDATRPLLQEKTAEDLGYLFRMRDEIYRRRQDYSLIVDNRTVDSVANEIAGFVRV